jgi:hypothetical protein
MEPEMNISSAKIEIAKIRRANKPANIVMGLCLGIAAIYIDVYMTPSRRGMAQQLTWSLFAVVSLFIGVRRVLRRKQLIGPFILTIMVQGLLAYALNPLFPFTSSLILIVFGVAGIFVLGFVFACFARLIDPFGPRPI